jgi:hypothetical protein
MALPLSSNATTEGAAADAAPILPFSCMTGASKEVLRHIQQGALSAKAKYFLTMIAIASFGNAGWQKQQGRHDPGLSCRFELSAWAQEHGWSRQSTWRIREQMVTLGILSYEPDPTHPQQGTLSWNLDYSQWQVLDATYRRQRYTRPGAGRPRRTEGAGQPKSKGLQSAEPSKGLQARADVERPQESEQTPMKSNGLQPSGKSNGLQKQSNGLQSPSAEEIKQVTSARAENTQEAVSDTAVRKALRKKERTTEPSDDGADARGASALVMNIQNNHDEGASGFSSSTASLASPSETEPTSCWPSRQEWEKTDLDYYQRVLRERESQQVALLTRLAHERIGVALLTTSYARIGALAKQCGAALLVKHILLAAANHIDGDPLDYLTKLAHSSHAGQARKKEASHGTTQRTHDGSDRPKRSGWEGWDVATAR